ncbi:helix-turn-helix domain-containing protein [Actinokineospora auranticolor]|uniref:HxlR-like helix-turn-helix protein n=1 Tax=Actinokineospora auranticolor TaxID=155976 RepID=A0A2S6GLE4_9PSEU|nr:helix-turn-helix domain-containing protein [Actinokineospora auranticolor]PPK66058.1 HxlR-like helix-turn-helix protein [Actinokineospora auranticolor]
MRVTEGADLRTLERNELLTRTFTPSVPVRVDYELTSLGQSLLEPIRHLKDWAESHRADVDAALTTNPANPTPRATGGSRTGAAPR